MKQQDLIVKIVLGVIILILLLLGWWAYFNLRLSALRCEFSTACTLHDYIIYKNISM